MSWRVMHFHDKTLFGDRVRYGHAYHTATARHRCEISQAAESVTLLGQGVRPSLIPSVMLNCTYSA